MAEGPHALIEQSKRLLRFHVDAEKSRELLESLPQGHGSGLDADMVDGLHAAEILAKARVSGGGGGGGSGEGMVKHGNEWHTLPFGQRCCQICEVDDLPEEVAGYAVLLSTDKHIYVGTNGAGNVCGCHFENVDELPASPEVGDAVFLVSDTHVHVGV
jgi:hypothetical protein